MGKNTCVCKHLAVGTFSFEHRLKNINYKMHIKPYESGLDFFGLLIFGLGSFVLISLLLFYYNKIPKSKAVNSVCDNPIYLSKDLLFHSTNLDEGFILVEKKTSTFIRFCVYALIVIVVCAPLHQLLGVVHFI